MFIETIDNTELRTLYINVNNITAICFDKPICEVYLIDGRVWYITKESYDRLLSKISLL